MGGWVGARRRSELTPSIAAAVFGQPPGAVVGPHETGHGWNLFMVALSKRPSFAEVKEQVRSRVFDELRRTWRAGARISFPLLQGT